LWFRNLEPADGLCCHIQICACLVAEEFVSRLVNVPVGEEDCRPREPGTGLLRLANLLLPLALLKFILERRRFAERRPGPFQGVAQLRE
jgi:hypothetical protein